MDIKELFPDGKTSITKEELEGWIKDNKMVSLKDGEYVGKDKFLKSENEKKELEAQLENSKKVNDDIEKQLKALQSESISKEDMDKRINELHQKYKTDIDKLNSDAENFKKDTLIKEALHHYNIQEGAEGFILSLLQKDIINVNDKGEIIGLKDQMNSIIENNQFAFKAGEKAQYSTPNASNVSGQGNNKIELSHDPDVLIGQLKELERNNPEQYKQVMRERGLM